MARAVWTSARHAHIHKRKLAGVDHDVPTGQEMLGQAGGNIRPGSKVKLARDTNCTVHRALEDRGRPRARPRHCPIDPHRQLVCRGRLVEQTGRKQAPVVLTHTTYLGRGKDPLNVLFIRDEAVPALSVAPWSIVSKHASMSASSTHS